MRKKIVITLVTFVLALSFALPAYADSSSFWRFWKRSGTALLPLNTAWTLGSSATRIAKGWFTDLDATTITIGGAAAGNLDMGGYIITNIGNAGTDFVASTGALNLADDLTISNAVNDGNPEISLGSSSAERWSIQSVYDSGAQTLNYVRFNTYTASAGADKGAIYFAVDDVDKMYITDASLQTGGAFFIEMVGNALAATTASRAVLTNKTAATAGVPVQVSPSLYLRGSGWKTDATAASQYTDWQSYVLPVQGTANPTSQLIFQSRVNEGAWGTRITIDSSTDLTLKGLLNAATGDEYALRLNYTTNKLTSGDDHGLYISQTDTTSPGTSWLAWLGVGATPKFRVLNDGSIYTTGNYLGSGYGSFLGGAVGISATTIFGVAGSYGIYSSSNFNVYSTVADGASAIALKLGANTAFSTAGAKLVSFMNASTEKLAITKDGTLKSIAANESTGAGTALLGTNSPAVTVSAPYTWLKFETSDGSVVYVPAWK